MLITLWLVLQPSKHIRCIVHFPFIEQLSRMERKPIVEIDKAILVCYFVRKWYENALEIFTYIIYIFCHFIFFFPLLKILLVFLLILYCIERRFSICWQIDKGVFPSNVSMKKFPHRRRQLNVTGINLASHLPNDQFNASYRWRDFIAKNGLFSNPNI